MYTLASETQDDWWEVEALFDLAFAPGREALSSYRLRDNVEPLHDLGRVARDRDGILGGAVRYWPIRVGKAAALLLGPIAVHPTRQGEGLGGALMREGLAAAFEKYDRVLLVGDEPYYSRFGFSRLHGVKMPPPTNPARVLGRGNWTGVQGVVQRAD